MKNNNKNQKLSLANLHKQELENSQLSKIIGGGTPGNCGCGCNGPSSTCDNGNANWTGGLHSPGVECVSCASTGDNTFQMFAWWQNWTCCEESIAEELIEVEP